MDILNRLTELAYSHASSMLIPTDHELMATFILLKEDNKFDVVCCPWSNDAEKKRMIMSLGLKIIRDNEPVKAYSFLSECWTSHYAQDEAPRADRPEHDPKRKEMVICAASDGMNRSFRAWEIGRDPQGRCISLASQPAAGTYESWMLDCVDKALQVADMKRDFQDINGTRG